MPCYRFAFAWIFLSYSLLAGCRAATPPAEAAFPHARIAASSRTVVLYNNGRTIPVPRFTADTELLWGPPDTALHSGSSKDFLLERSPQLDLWLPHIDDRLVHAYLQHMRGSRRSTTSTVLERAQQYLPLLTEAVHRKGLPEEIACLPLVESAFEPRCVSSAGAAGLWQLMPVTARRFGLRVDAQVDERFDTHKATEAATSYLVYLHQLFGDWPLALAAYNCGEGTLQRAIQRYGTRRFEELVRHCRDASLGPPALQEETLRYVSRFAAAALVMFGHNSSGALALRPSFPDRGVSSLQAEPGERRIRLQGIYEEEDTYSLPAARKCYDSKTAARFLR